MERDSGCFSMGTETSSESGVSEELHGGHLGHQPGGQNEGHPGGRRLGDGSRVGRSRARTGRVNSLGMVIQQQV